MCEASARIFAEETTRTTRGTAAAAAFPEARHHEPPRGGGATAEGIRGGEIRLLLPAKPKNPGMYAVTTLLVLLLL